MVNKWAVVAIVVILAIAAAAAYVYLSIFPPAYSGPAAKLVISAGTVEINRGNGWSLATSGIALEVGWSVRTGAASRAVIIFMDSSVARLGENTEVRITKITSGANSTVELEQLAGSTWNKILKLSGITEYTVNTPTAVASVRGTAFAVRLDAANDTDVGVAEGNVTVGSVRTREEIVAGVRKEIREIVAEKNITVQQAAVVRKAALETIEERALQEDSWTRENRDLDQQHVQEIKTKLVAKYSNFISLAKSQLKLTDQQIQDYIDGYIRGDYSIKRAIDQGIIPEQYVSYIPEELRRY